MYATDMYGFIDDSRSRLADKLVAVEGDVESCMFTVISMFNQCEGEFEENTFIENLHEVFLDFKHDAQRAG